MMKATEDIRVKVAVYRPKIEAIINSVADYLGLEPKEIGRRKRYAGIIKGRKLACYHIRKNIPNCPLIVIGYLLNPHDPFDHADISHNASKYEKELNLKRRDGSYVYPELQLENIKLTMLIESQLNYADRDAWLLDFSRRSGNFMIRDTV